LTMDQMEKEEEGEGKTHCVVLVVAAAVIDG
jgi:hypothetical protein